MDNEYLLVQHLDNLYLGTSGYHRLAIGLCVEFLNRAVEADLHLALSLTLWRDAQIDIDRLAHSIIDVKGTIVLQLHHGTEDGDEDGHEEATHKKGDDDKQNTVLDGVPQTDSRPAHTEQEVDDVAKREEMHGTGIVGCVAAGIGIDTRIKVVIAHPHKGEDCLDDEDYRRENSYAPKDAERGIEQVEPIYHWEVKS